MLRCKYCSKYIYLKVPAVLDGVPLLERGDAIVAADGRLLPRRSRYPWPTFSANLWPILSLSETGCNWKAPTPAEEDGRGVSEPSRRNGVPSISPHVISGDAPTPGTGDGVFMNSKPLTVGGAFDLISFPSTSTWPCLVLVCSWAALCKASLLRDSSKGFDW